MKLLGIGRDYGVELWGLWMWMSGWNDGKDVWMWWNGGRNDVGFGV